MTTTERLDDVAAALALARAAADLDRVEIDAARAVILDLSATVEVQAARIVELEALLNPSPMHVMRVGASVQRRGGESWPGALNRFETSIGRRVRCVRRFTSGAPSVTDDAFVDVLADPQYDALILSFKSGTQAEIERFMRDLPVVEGRTYYLALFHEPDKQLRLTPAAFQALCARLEAADQNVNRADISLAAILMTWLERDGDPGTSSADYMPPPSPRWVLLMDPYFSKPENTYASQCAQTVALWRALGGTRIGIAEFGVKTTGQQAADQITAIATDARADGCETLSYFDSNVGDNAGAGWYLDLRGPAAETAFASLI